MLHVDRNFYMGAIKYKKTETDSEFIATIMKWLYHFTNEIETVAQMNDSYAKLEEFIADAQDDTKLTDALVNYTSKHGYGRVSSHFSDFSANATIRMYPVVMLMQIVS
jgi:hypothetical protein